MLSACETGASGSIEWTSFSISTEAAAGRARLHDQSCRKRSKEVLGEGVIELRARLSCKPQISHTVHLADYMHSVSKFSDNSV
jgi:hypothetical protein